MKEKITKKEFISEITNVHSKFIGVVPQELSEKNLMEIIPYVLKNQDVEWRTCKARSRDIQFKNNSGDTSYLDFHSDFNHEFHKIVITDYTVLQYSYRYENEWGDSWSKYLYYLLQ